MSIVEQTSKQIDKLLAACNIPDLSTLTWRSYTWLGLNGAGVDLRLEPYDANDRPLAYIEAQNTPTKVANTRFVVTLWLNASPKNMVCNKNYAYIQGQPVVSAQLADDIKTTLCYLAIQMEEEGLGFLSQVDNWLESLPVFYHEFNSFISWATDFMEAYGPSLPALMLSKQPKDFANVVHALIFDLHFPVSALGFNIEEFWNTLCMTPDDRTLQFLCRYWYYKRDTKYEIFNSREKLSVHRNPTAIEK